MQVTRTVSIVVDMTRKLSPGSACLAHERLEKVMGKDVEVTVMTAFVNTVITFKMKNETTITNAEIKRVVQSVTQLLT